MLSSLKQNIEEDDLFYILEYVLYIQQNLKILNLYIPDDVEQDNSKNFLLYFYARYYILNLFHLIYE